MLETRDFFNGRRILVTGGCGSVGRLLVKRLLDYGAERVRILDHSELALANTRAYFPDHSRLRFFLGDIRDAERVRRACDGADLIFHLAALKHVPICEYDPFEAVLTNVEGTMNIIRAALENGTEKVIYASTDKAVNPSSVMGTTKLLGEKLMAASGAGRGDLDTRFASVRFGNVINSSGSVIPIFREQVMHGGPLTLTDEGMTRYFISMELALDLLCEAAVLCQGGEVVVKKMPIIRVADLAAVMIRRLAPHFGQDPEAVCIEQIGVRPGEKLYEELMTFEESLRAVETDSHYIILPLISEQLWVKHEYEGARELAPGHYNSEKSAPLGQDEVDALLTENDLLEIQ